MALTYLIDGYNVLHHCPSLRRIVAHDFETARETLVDRVARFCAASGEKALVVFDGRGRRGKKVQPRTGQSGVFVIYSPGNKSADAFIEREVYGARDRRSVVVVSADRGILDLCQGLGTLIMRPDGFLATLAEHLTRERASLASHRNHHSRSTLGDRLDTVSLKRLEAARKRIEG